MNSHNQNPLLDHSGAEPGAADETLWLIARLAAPEGLEDRVHAGLLSRPRGGRLLAWPAAPRLDSSWMRSAAAAAIVFVVAGGGWGIYSRVQQPAPARAVAQPPRVSAPGGFSSAGAMRTPQTLNGPVLAHPVAPQPAQGKIPVRTAKKPARHALPSTADKSAGQAAASPAR